ncbi:unnamed protein product [Protopolystoma xenopodis]|uniref:Uncharacterized protein n=1 Tax=Protopolystoma xenopodis TaxID=117903 RepID=A0A448WHH3_9PLAT|nr:unnamed protein product [Protopolystoma xenopodis]
MNLRDFSSACASISPHHTLPHLFKWDTHTRFPKSCLSQDSFIHISPPKAIPSFALSSLTPIPCSNTTSSPLNRGPIASTIRLPSEMDAPMEHCSGQTHMRDKPGYPPGRFIEAEM